MDEMELPDNSISMLGGDGPVRPHRHGRHVHDPQGPRASSRGDDDPGWYEHPAGTVAGEGDRRRARARRHQDLKWSSLMKTDPRCIAFVSPRMRRRIRRSRRRRPPRRRSGSDDRADGTRRPTEPRIRSNPGEAAEPAQPAGARSGEGEGRPARGRDGRVREGEAGVREVLREVPLEGTEAREREEARALRHDDVSVRRSPRDGGAATRSARSSGSPARSRRCRPTRRARSRATSSR